VGSYKDIIPDPHAIEHLGSRPDRHAVPDDHIVLYQNMVTDAAVGADTSAWQNVSEG
jgi:hypothetical protein